MSYLSYNPAIAAHGGAGQSEEAVTMLREMKEVGLTPNVTTYSSAISVCGNGGRWGKALALLGEMPAAKESLRMAKPTTRASRRARSSF